MTTTIHRLITAADNHPPAAAAVTIAAVVILAAAAILATRIVRRRKWTGEQAGTLVAAAIATGVSAQGMWVFFDESLHLTMSLRIMFFAFLEIMVLTSALRARAAQAHGGSAGVDGIAMWILTSLSAILAATDADNLGTLLVRLSAPLVAAWGWERSMALERRRAGHLDRINWRVSPERILIRLGLADPTDRTASEAAAQRRLIDVALAVDHAKTLRDTGARPWRINRSKQQLQKAMRRAIEDGGLIVEPGRDRQAVLLDNIRMLSGTTALLELDLPHPWVPSPAESADTAIEPVPTTAEQPPSPPPDPSAAQQELPNDADAEPADYSNGDAQGRHDPRPARQLRKDPTVRARVLELRAANTPVTEIAAALDTSPRTIGRILADLDAESSSPAADLPTRQDTPDPAGPWPDGLRIITTDTDGPKVGADAESEVLDAEVVDDDQLEIGATSQRYDRAGGSGR